MPEVVVELAVEVGVRRVGEAPQVRAPQVRHGGQEVLRARSRAHALARLRMAKTEPTPGDSDEVADGAVRRRKLRAKTGRHAETRAAPVSGTKSSVRGGAWRALG